MKITITELILNKAVKEEKLELANWLIEMQCPYNDTVYCSNFKISVLDWLKLKGLFFTNKILSVAIESNCSLESINWFLNNGAQINKDAIISAIRMNKQQILDLLISKNKVVLGKQELNVAVISGNTSTIQLLKNLIDDDIIESAIKNKNKDSIRWLVLNNYI
jgi:hypothetical protein